MLKIDFKSSDVMNFIDRKQSQVFFVNGPGRTGKTFIYRALMATLRNRGKIGIETVSSELIRVVAAIIWDEAPMTNIYDLEALDRTLKDILDCDASFCGKVMIMGGDFRSVLLVIQKGSKLQMIYGYENTWQSLSVVLRGTTQMYNVKSADKKVT
ncbi:PIF1-like helicase [Medicago truncatula]|uniref:ATP-dependent DNA helicase n=1 Tax=Medicago truncatula TaxID=3880 RepID=A0A072V5Q8_MEDTR|nr:PIF1-like helicase [Medicago truncatula]